MEKSINEKEQCVQTDVMQSVLANELRIGSWINYLGKYMICSTNTIHAVSKIIQPSVMYQPIPLTEEWLFKLGYDLISENHYGILGHLIWKIEGRFYCDKNGMQLKHVHQLQNLYFALTGSELTVA